MHDALMVYFNGEKYAGLLLAGVGAEVSLRQRSSSERGSTFARSR
jgi:hypothetical protein